VRLYCVRIDEQFGGRPVSRRQSVKEVCPDAFGRPSLKAIVERLPWAVDRRCVFPALVQFSRRPADAAWQFALCYAVNAAFQTAGTLLASGRSLPRLN
jgi:hypothetical protein